ncbi:o-succinylbenzoate synthase [Actinotignum sp. GS-2025a]|uniref:o-succinylbenzoate synthase n=1 Tax=unclassified Actinotignum TaxID=2632702 RepID=UPI003F47E87A
MLTELVNPFPELSRVLAYSIPLKRRFRGITVREGLLLEGPAGWGEAAPFWDYDPRESARWLRAGIEASTRPFPRPLRSHIPVNVTIPVTTPADAARLVRSAAGCTTAKVKVADPRSTLREDCERVAAVAAALGPGGKVRVDANAAWDTDTAIRAITELDAAARAGGLAGLEYVEQPCKEIAELARVRSRVAPKIAADESIRRASDPLAVARAGAADIAVIKVAPLGGISNALDVARECGLDVVLSSALETSVGIAAGLAAAAALDRLPYACGLATVQLLSADIVREAKLPRAGVIECGRAAVDTSQLSAAPDLAARWQRRLSEMMEWYS